MNSTKTVELAEVRELKLDALRHEAIEKGTVKGLGVRPVGSPFPVASPETGYYGHHLLKEPQWTKLVPLYFFVGGAAGSLGVIGALADLTGTEQDVALTARWMALGGAALSGVLLVIDLGRPKRFLNMLRVFKPQSTMSMGSWVLSGFSLSAGLASAADLLRKMVGPGIFSRSMGLAGRAGLALFGMPFHNYTGVLIGTTAIPVWNSHVRQLPREFGMSGLQAGVSLLEVSGYESRSSLNLLGLLSCATETVEFARGFSKPQAEDAPLRKGTSGALVMASAVLSGPLPLGLRIAAMAAPKKHQRKLRIAAALAGVLGSLCLRYGWVKAGAVSAQDWKLPLRKAK